MLLCLFYSRRFPSRFVDFRNLNLCLPSSTSSSYNLNLNRSTRFEGLNHLFPRLYLGITAQKTTFLKQYTSIPSSMPPPRGRFAVASKPTGPSKAIGCCKMTFSSDQAYENHLLNSANHFACKYCLVDHRTAEGLKRHMNQVRMLTFRFPEFNAC